MPLARAREFSRTLRFRLVFWNTVVLLGSLLFTLVLLRESVRYSLRTEFERQLLEDLQEVILTVEQTWPDEVQLHQELERKAVSHSHRGWWTRVFSPKGRVLWASSNAPSLPLPVSLFTRHDEIIASGDYRIIHHRLQGRNLPDWIIKVGVSFAPIEAELRGLTAQIALIGGVAMFLAPLGGFFLATRATRPISQIIATAAGLQPQSLDARLVVRGTDDELDRLSRTINGLLDRIAAYLNQMREFTSNAAHELRSPLAAIQSSLEVALDSDRSTEDYRALLDDVLEECTELAKLVNQLLALAEVDAGLSRTNNQVVELEPLVDRSLQMFQGVADVAGVRLLKRPLGSSRGVVGDAARLRQVINNLVDNAIKFTPEGGTVTVTLDCSGANAVRLSVADTGAGIEPVDLPHIFDRFYRADKSRKRTDGPRGTGLGLSICQAIVHAHDGKLTVDSLPGRGATFTITLPAAGVGSESQTPVRGVPIVGASSGSA
jgi:heavy metal sensor kinase